MDKLSKISFLKLTGQGAAGLALASNPFKIEGPLLTSPGPSMPTSSAGKITTAAKTIVTQYVNVGDSVWERNFPSTYVTAPYK